MSKASTITEVLEEFCPGVDCASSTTLVDSRILDSLTMVAFVAELEEVFDIEIPPVEIIADNFNSVEAISTLVSRLLAESTD